MRSTAPTTWTFYIPRDPAPIRAVRYTGANARQIMDLVGVKAKWHDGEMYLGGHWETWEDPKTGRRARGLVMGDRVEVGDYIVAEECPGMTPAVVYRRVAGAVFEAGWVREDKGKMTKVGGEDG
jgi:hypothetical protein